MSISLTPYKANSPLVIDANTVLTRTVSFEFLQAVGWWNAQIFQADCIVQHSKFAVGDLLYVLRKFAGTMASKYLLSFFALKGLDHTLII